MLKKTKIAILGCGTVGSSVLKILKKYPEIEVTKVLVRDKLKHRDLDIASDLLTSDIEDLFKDDEVEIFVELMGGVTQTKTILLRALESGKNIVTANKDLLALEGEDLFETAKKMKKTIQYEAAVAGGIPIISTLKQSLRANKIERICGIINGTTNYILDAMEKNQSSFEEELKKAQALGFAESDPTNDIDAHDAAYKISILASIVTAKRINVNKVYREGIRNISLADIRSAAKRGFRIKLLGIVDNKDERPEVRVHPCFVPLENPLASVSKENNAILVKGDAVKDLTLIGKGAGGLPTASSVVGDILMISSQLRSSSEPHPQHVCPHTEYAEIKNMNEVKNPFYVRVSMVDKIGVLKDLGLITERHQANVKFIDQYEAQAGEAHADFVIDPIEEKEMRSIIEDINKLDSIQKVESVIRILR
jgi:homoserine dehydrogenase